MNGKSTIERQRLRVCYQHGAALRFISHLDVIRTFERALRRARLPIVYSQGFSPHPRLTWAAPLALGFTSDAEMVDCLLSPPIEPTEFAERLSAQLPVALRILSVAEVPANAPTLPAALTQTRYRVCFTGAASNRVHGEEPWASLERGIVCLLASENIIRPLRGKRRGHGTYDLRPLIVRLETLQTSQGQVLEMTLRSQSPTVGRPEEVLDALGYGDASVQILRLEMEFAPAVAPEEAR
jgi:radical SAM-linked protein